MNMFQQDLIGEVKDFVWLTNGGTMFSVVILSHLDGMMDHENLRHQVYNTLFLDISLELLTLEKLKTEQ